MPLETLQKGAQVNILDLTIEIPFMKPAHYFDARRDIEPADIEQIAKYLYSFQNSTQRNEIRDLEAASAAANFRILFPNNPTPIITDEELFENLNYSSLLGQPKYYAVCRQLFPERTMSVFSTLIRDYITKRIALAEITEPTTPYHTLDKMFSKMVADPTWKLTSYEENRLESRINDFLLTETSHTARAAALARTRIVLGKNFDLGVKPQEWQSFQETLRAFQANQDWLSFLELAKNMQILAADELRVTENGIETIFHDKPSFQAEPPPLPEARRF